MAVNQYCIFKNLQHYLSSSLSLQVDGYRQQLSIYKSVASVELI